ncbi:MAG: hypothetical protein IMY84_02350 [Chloroflexi bacterium]|nr:hypothetical protein [Chloroflexota bacterium]
MKNTWKPTAGGILAIIGGAINLLAGLGLTLFVFVPFQTGLITVGVLGALFLGTVIVALIGGISALQRKRWGLSLAGAICAVSPPSTLLGILSIVFISMARDEFTSTPSPASKPPELPGAGKESDNTGPGSQPIPCNPDFSEPGEGERNA